MAPASGGIQYRWLLARNLPLRARSSYRVALIGEPVRPAASQPGVAHNCIRVAELEPIRAATLATLQGDTTEITEGAVKELRGLYMRYPNGIMIELVEAAS
jgi:hypothetical protein